MNRYFYYIVILISMMNVMFNVPQVLINYRFTGAIASLPLGGLIGTILAFLFTSGLNRYPGKGLPEIMELHLPKAVARTLSFLFAVMWYVAGTLPLVGYAYVLNRFLNPDASPVIIFAVLVLVCGYAASRSTLTVMLLLEIMLILIAPIVLFMTVKAMTSHDISWDAVRTVANYITVPPAYTPVAASAYLFAGYMHMVIFNRLLPPNFRFHHRWLIPVNCFFFLLTYFFMPIGYHGTMGVAKYMYVWEITADSMVMSYGFIERVLFLFLFVYLNLTLIHTVTVWHQAMEFMKSAVTTCKPTVDHPKTPAANYVICGLFVALSFLYMLLSSEKIDFNMILGWLQLRFGFEIVLALALFVLSRRRPRRV